MYTNAKGIDLGKDITVVNANFAVARAQLEADRVDAALVIEPLASIIAKQNPSWHMIFNGARGWKEMTGEQRMGDRDRRCVPTRSPEECRRRQRCCSRHCKDVAKCMRQQHRRSRQDRQRDGEASARHFHRGGGRASGCK